MNWEKIKNWIFGGAGAAALIVFYQFMQWQVAVEVKTQVEAALGDVDLGTDVKIVAMDAERASNKRTGEENTKDIEGLETRVHLAFKALIEGE